MEPVSFREGVFTVNQAWALEMNRLLHAASVRAAPLVITAGAADSPSDWLKDALWCERVGAAFEGRRAATSCSDGERAEVLMRLVSPRLDRHIQQRVDPKKHDSWVFRYVRENLAALAAIAVRFGHAVLDLVCA